MSTVVNKTLEEFILELASNPSEFFLEFDNISITFLSTQLVPYDQAWTASTNQLDPTDYWDGFVSSPVTIPMTLHQNGWLTSSSAGDGIYTGAYAIELLSTYPAAENTGQDCMIGVEVRLTVTAADVVTSPAAVQTIRGYMQFLTFPTAVANQYYNTFPAERDACYNGMFSPYIVCASVVGVDSAAELEGSAAGKNGENGGGGSGNNSVAWTALALVIALILVAIIVLCIILVNRRGKNRNTTRSF